MSSSEVPCPACKWTPDQQRGCAYESSVRAPLPSAQNFFSKNAGKIPLAMRSSTLTSSKRILPCPSRQPCRSGPRARSISRSSSGCLGYRWRRSGRQSPNLTGKDSLVRLRSIWGSSARSTLLRCKVSMANRFGVFISFTMMKLGLQMGRWVRLTSSGIF